MKQVKIRIQGDLVIVDYCSKKKMQELVDGVEYDDECDVFANNYYVTGAWDEISALYVDDDEDNNLVNQNGQYVNTKEFFHDLFSEDGGHPLPVEVHYEYYYEQELEYVIRLKDDEEFDIKKVQLIKSEDETSLFPYFVLCEKILYDGKDVLANPEYNEWSEYCPDEDDSYDEDVIEEFI